MPLWKKLLFAGCLLFLALGVAEGLLRLAGVSFPLPYRPDPYCGSRLQASFCGWFSQEGAAYVCTNRHGHRDVERPVDKPANTWRIAVLGDSFCEALQVELSETFWKRLEQQLAGDPRLGGRRLEVLNFGVSGYGTGQEYQMLERYVWPFQPDLVLVAMFPENDVINNSARLDPDPVKPFFTWDGDTIVRDDSFRQHPIYLKASSAWGQLKTRAINGVRLLQLAREARLRWRQRATMPPPDTLPLTWQSYRPPQSDDWKDAWLVTERLLDAIHQACRAHDARMAVMIVSTPPQVDPSADQRERMAERLGTDDLLYPNRRLVAWGKAAGVPVWDTAPHLQQLAEETGTYWHGFANSGWGSGHWNEAGHAEVAAWLADRAAADLLPVAENSAEHP